MDQVVPIEGPMEVVVGEDIVMEMAVTMATTMTSTPTVSVSSSCDNDEVSITDNSVGSDDISHLTRRVMAREKVGSLLAHIHMLHETDKSKKFSRLDNTAKDEIEDSKRLRDREKKRIQRANKLYRKKETEKCKVRMASKRNDPEYREMERQRDRERRALARKNKKVREKEREKDRGYKKKQRNNYLRNVQSETDHVQTYARSVIPVNESCIVETGDDGYCHIDDKFSFLIETQQGKHCDNGREMHSENAGAAVNSLDTVGSILTVKESTGSGNEYCLTVTDKEGELATEFIEPIVFINPASRSTHQGTCDNEQSVFSSFEEDGEGSQTDKSTIADQVQTNKTPVINRSALNSSFITNTGITLNDICRVTGTNIHTSVSETSENDFRDSSAIQGLIELGSETNSSHEYNTITLYADET